MTHTRDANCRRTCLLWLAGVGLVAGCSVTGTWKRVSIDPPQVPFPLDDLLLDGDGNYSAQWEHEGREYGSYGTYDFRAGKLIITQHGAMPREYGARLRLDGKLELSYTVDEDTVTAVLERRPEPKPEQPPQDASATPRPNKPRPGPSGPTDANKESPPQQEQR